VRVLWVFGLMWCCFAQTTVALAEASTGPRSRPVAAKVNGVAIETRALEQVLEGVLAVDERARSDPQRRDELRRAALESLIDFELLFQESQRRGIRIDPGAVAAEMKRAEQKVGGAGAYAEALRSHGWTRSEIERDAERALAVNRLLEMHVWRDLRIEDSAIAAFYERHKEEFRHPQQVRVRHILVSPGRETGQANWEAARKRADVLRQRILGGEDFAELARRESADHATAQSGGDLGWVSQGELQEEFEHAVQSLAPGQVSSPVRSPLGYHVIQVTARRDAGVAPLEEVADRIKDVLLRRERQRRKEEFTRNLRAHAVIQYFDLSGRETPGDASP